MKKREIITSTIFCVLLLLIYSLFPVKNLFQNFLTAIFFFFILPILYIKIILKKHLDFFGVTMGKIREGIFYASSSTLIVLLGMFFIIKYTTLIKQYVLPMVVAQNFGLFLLYEFGSVLLFVIMYEFFFRGFVYFTLEGVFKKWAIFIQMALFLILVLFTGIFKWNFIPFIIFSPFAGLIVYKSRSIVYSMVAQFIVIFLVDTYIIYLIK